MLKVHYSIMLCLIPRICRLFHKYHITTVSRTVRHRVPADVSSAQYLVTIRYCGIIITTATSVHVSCSFLQIIVSPITNPHTLFACQPFVGSSLLWYQSEDSGF